MQFFNHISSFKVKKKTSTMMKWLSLLLLLGAFPSFAFAANLFDPSSGDVSLKVLGAIFGGLLDAGGQDPLLAGIKVFNGGVLLIGGVLAAYTIFAGVLGTAHDGEMLGKKFSSLWIPIRYSVGTALVLPVIGGGYCVMQAIVMWLVVQGIGLADGVWQSFMSNPTSTANPNINNVSKDKILAVAKSAFLSSVCYKSFAQATADAPSVLNWLTTYNYTKSQTSTGYVYGDSKSLVTTNGCGEVNYPQNKDDPSIVTNPTPSAGGGYFGDIGTIFAPLDMSYINKAHTAQTDALVQKMDDLAGQVIQKPDMTPAEAQGYYKQITAAVDNYAANIKSAATGSSENYDAIKQSASNQGWILAGAWFTRIVQMNQRVQAAVNSFPTATGFQLGLDSVIFKDATKYLKTANAVLNSDTSAPPQDYFGTTDTTDQQKAAKIESSGGLIQKIEATITEFLTGVNLYELKNDTRHPLIIMQEMGSRIVWATLAMMGALALASGALSAVPILGNAVPSVLTVFQMFMGLPIQGLMSVALGMQYILPNMPFIIWIGCIVGWTLLVIEAIIAAPLWAIMHLHPNGDDLTGRGGNGYSLVLSLLLRPVLMVFGMMASIVISGVIGEFINKTFFEVFAMNTGAFTGFSALLALFMGTLLYFTVMFTFIRKVFGIIHQIPDQLLKWIGGGGGGLGEFAGEFNRASDQAAGVAAGAAGGLAGKGGGMLAQSAQQKLQNNLSEAASEKGLENKGGFSAWAARNASSLIGTPLSQNASNEGTRGGDGSDAGRTVLRSARGQAAYDQLQANKNNSNLNNNANWGGAASARDEMAAELGSGDNPMNASALEDFKNAYSSGISQAGGAAGGTGAQSFATQMKMASENGFADYGNSASTAAKTIGGQIMNNAISQSGLSSAGQDYVRAMGTSRSQGGLVGSRVGEALSHARIVQNTAGGQADQVFSAALAKQSEGPRAMRDVANTAIAAIETQRADTPRVADTPEPKTDGDGKISV